MREGWKEVKLGEILEIKHGYGFKGEYFTDEETEDILVTPGNFQIGGGFKGDKLKFYKGPVNENFVLKENDVVVTMTDLSKMADTIGFSAKIPAKSNQRYLHNQRIGLVSLLDESFDLNFIYWLLRTGSYQRYIAGSSIGATVKHTSPSKIYTAKVIVPEDKETQRKIASILSGYDDLIENNLKRIKILEEMAQQTYEEWFVRMRFPGYETAVMNEETGLPEGWENGTLENITKYLSGFAFKSAQFKDNGNGVIRIKNIGNNTINLSDVAYVDNEYASKQKRYLLKSGDLLIAMTGATIGKVGIMPHSNERFYLNQRVGKFLTENTAFINCFFNSTYGINQILNIAGGAAQPNISAQQILNIELILPPKEILEKFAKPFNKQISIIINLQSQNQRLRETRDLLLPRLMMGILEV